MNFIKKISATLFLVFFLCAVNAQTSATYFSHTIAAGETLSALAKQYGTTVGNIMRLNHMNTQSVLTIGEVVKIPTKSSAPINATTTTPHAVISSATTPPIINQNIPKPTPSTVSTNDVITPNGTPIMHIVAPHELLYTLAKQFHTTIPAIKAWNNMTSDVIIDGHKIIVGYTPHASTTLQSSTQKLSAPQQQMPVDNTIPATPQSTLVTQPVNNNNDNASVQQSTNTEEKINSTTGNQTAMPPVTDNNSPTLQPPATNVTVPVPVPKNNAADMNNPEGYFASLFGLGTEGRTLQSGSGTSMTFKTASGWNDKKYYILMNDVPPGSIVKIMAANYKVIYAKVLWSMNAMKENTGLDYRISTAAAAALGLSDAKFPLTVTFFE